MRPEFTRQHDQLIEEHNRLIGEQADTVHDLRTRLLSLEERDSNPDDERVTDLTQRLLDTQELLHARNVELDTRLEELRLIAAGGQPGGPGSESQYRGFLDGFEDAQAVALAIATGDRRAIDTATISSNGAFPTETLQRFLDFVVSKSAMLQRITTMRIRGASRRLDRIDVSGRNIRPTTEGAALAVSDAVTFDGRTITPVGIGWNEDVTREWMEDNIEGPSGLDHIAEAVATAFANDVVDLACNGHDASSDAFLTTLDGFSALARADANVVDRDGTTESDTAPTHMLKGMLGVMPAEYRMLPGMAYTVPQAVALNYADELSQRATALGDRSLVSGAAGIPYFGLPVYGETYFSSTEATAETADAAILTPDSNLAVGFSRDITFTAEWHPRKRVWELTLDARMGVQHAYGGVLVLNDNIPSDLTDL